MEPGRDSATQLPGDRVPVRHAYRTKAELIYEHIRHDVASGAMAPGERIVLDQIAAAHGVSKVPVREAITRLVGEGLVQVQPHVGPIVAALSPDEIVETAIIRASLESTALELGVPRMARAAVDAMRQLLEEMEELKDSKAAGYASLNRRFHSLPVSACAAPRLVRLVEAQAEHTERYRTVQRVPAYWEESQAEHRAIFAAVDGGRANDAAGLTRTHVLTAAYRLRDALAEGRA